MKSRASLMAMLAIAAGTLLGAASGCELIAGVDRNKIDTGGAGGTGGATGGTTGGGGATGGMTTGGTTTGGTGGAPCDPANCPAPSGECKVAYCDDMGACAEKNADDGTVAATQIAGDCKKNVCMGGAVTSANDDADIEVDSTDCTTDTCANGSPVHEPVAANTACSDNGGAFCDDAGACVECNLDNQCTVDPDVKCDTPNHQCVTPFCIDLVKGQNETDVDCGGPDCAKCADDLVCAVAGDCQSNNCVSLQCVAGTCQDGILNNMQLGETDVDCGGSTCGKCGFDKACKLNSDCKSADCNAMLKCNANCADQEKDQDETDKDCGGAICGKCANTKACLIAGDCLSGFCNGNVCEACSSDLQCAGNQYCSAGVCVADLPTGSVCQAGTQCTTNNCVDGVCCGAASCGTCQACNVGGSEGACVDVAAGNNDDTCTAAQNKQCDGTGGCKSVNGQVCAMGTTCLSANCVDGVCCANACAGTCKACNVAGSVGSCVNVPLNSDDTFPANACVGTNSCDGNGACKKDNGASCSLAGECLSGNCVDNVCCGSASCATCQTCNGGTPGTCTNITSGQPDNNPVAACTGNNQCDGNGACKKINGQSCAAVGDCLSGFCVDTVCCNTSCTTSCNSCNVTGLAGTCSIAWAGDDPHNNCQTPGDPADNCNGAGACGLGAAGAPCSGNSGCSSNMCTGNICAP